MNQKAYDEAIEKAADAATPAERRKYQRRAAKALRTGEPTEAELKVDGFKRRQAQHTTKAEPEVVPDPAPLSVEQQRQLLVETGMFDDRGNFKP
jgi:hypothetical protein